MQDNYFEVYNGYKDDVLNVLAEAVEFYQQQGMEKQVKTIQENIGVIKSGEFEVVVVGEFSSGKSTFLNALMREKYLPSYTKETTATINYLRNSSESDSPGIAYYYDGHKENLTSLDYDVVAQYVSTKNKDMKVEENIAHLDLFLDSPFLENKVTLIDSPGLNGMKKGLGDITDAQIRKSHAVIFMFSAEQSGKRSEFEYLKKVKDQVNTVFLVLNKIDCIKESEHETVEDKIQDLIDSYKSVFPDDTSLPEIIPVAAYPALVARSKLNLDYPQNHFDITEEEKAVLEEKSNMKVFEEKLLHFLTNSEKTITQIKEPVQRLSTALYESISRYEAEIVTVENQNDGAKLQEQISNLKVALLELEEKLNVQRSTIYKAIKKVEKETLDTLDKELEDVSRQGKLSIDELDNIDTLGDYFELLNKLLDRKLSGVRDRIEQNFQENFFDEVQSQYMGIVNSLEEKMEEMEFESITFDAKINVSAKSIDAGLENFSAMREELKQKIEGLETRKREVSIKEEELIELSYQSEELKSRLGRLEKSESELRSSFCPPEVVVTYKPIHKETDRTGWFHRTRDWFFGKRTEASTVPVSDDSARKEYLSNYYSQIEQLNDKRDELERKLDSLVGVEKKSEHARTEREDIQSELNELRDEARKMTVKFNNDLNEKYDKEIIRIKRKALGDMEEYLAEIKPKIKDALKRNRKIYGNLLQNLIEQSVMKQIEQKKEECDNLVKLKEEANDNKEMVLGEKKELKNRALNLKKKTDEILERINTIEIDKVKYQAI